MNKKQIELRQIGKTFTFSILITVIISLIYQVFIQKYNIDSPWWVGTLLSESCALFPFLYMVKKDGYNLGEYIRFLRIKPSTVALTILLTITSSPIASLANLVSQLFVPNTMINASEKMLQSSTWILILVSAIIAPLCEEITLRGIVFHQYRRNTTALKAILMSGLFFGLFHLNINQFSYALVLGILFAIVNMASGSIWTSFLMHLLINGFNSILMVLINFAYQMNGKSYLEEAEKVRTSASMAGMIKIYALLAVFGMIFSCIIIYYIAKNEGNLDELSSIFSKEKMESEERKTEDARVLNLPTIIGIMLPISVMLGLMTIIKTWLSF